MTRSLARATLGLLALLVLGTVAFATLAGLSWGDAIYLTVLDSAGAADPDTHVSAVARTIQALVTLVGIAIIPLVTAVVVDAAVSARFAGTPQRPRPRRGHVVVVGLGNVGVRVVEQLHERGVPVVAVDDDEGAGRRADPADGPARDRRRHDPARRPSPRRPSTTAGRWSRSAATTSRTSRPARRPLAAQPAAGRAAAARRRPRAPGRALPRGRGLAQRLVPRRPGLRRGDARPQGGGDGARRAARSSCSPTSRSGAARCSRACPPSAAESDGEVRVVGVYRGRRPRRGARVPAAPAAPAQGR